MQVQSILNAMILNTRYGSHAFPSCRIGVRFPIGYDWGPSVPICMRVACVYLWRGMFSFSHLRPLGYDRVLRPDLRACGVRVFMGCHVIIFLPCVPG